MNSLKIIYAIKGKKKGQVNVEDRLEMYGNENGDWMEFILDNCTYDKDRT